MHCSIIVPVYNSHRTLKYSLEAIFESSYKNFEVIVVDDCSADGSSEIARQFPCKIITTDKNSGSGKARNAGAENSKGEILVFIDSDVVIKKDALNIILGSFDKDSELAAVIGCFSLEHPNKNFFSQYKNIYMNFIFNKMPEYVDFLFTSICAIRKEAFFGFLTDRLKTDDTALGQRYKMAGKKILLNKNLRVVHLKNYSLKAFVINDFTIPYEWAKIFLRYAGFKDILKKRRFAHAGLNQILSVIIAPFVLISAIGIGFYPNAVLITSILVFIFFILNLQFFTFLYLKKGVIFTITSIIVTYVDMLIMGFGILAGFISYFASKRNPAQKASLP